MADAHANFAASLVATAPSPATSGMSLVVTSGEGTRFPAVPFNAVIAPATAQATPANAEVVRVTARSTDTLTITRAQESSSARTVVVGDRIYAGVTAATLDDYIPKSIVLGKGSMITATGTSAPVVLTVGADYTRLRADSTQASGLVWAADTNVVPVAPPILGTLTSTATGAINTWYALRFAIATETTFSGIRIVTGGTANGNMRAALYASDTTTKLADRTTDLAQAAAGNITALNFDATYDAVPGLYYALVWFSSATATFLGGRYPTLASTGTNATTTPANVGTPAFSASLTRPQFALY